MELVCPRCNMATPVPARECRHCAYPLTSRAAASAPVQPVTWNQAAPVAPPPPLTPSVQGAVATEGLSINPRIWVNGVGGFMGSLIASVLFLLLKINATRYGTFGLAIIVGGIAGFCILAALTATPELLARQPKRAAQLGVRAGLVGAGAMLVAALLIAALVHPADIFFIGRFFHGLFAWTAFGLTLGIVEGIVGRSQRRALIGAAGGALGGIVAYLIGFLIHNEGTFVIVGLLIGLGTGLLQQLYKQAWLSVIAGATEGTELIIDKPRLLVGSSDAPGVDLGLYQDAAIAPQHFEIQQRGGAYRLQILSGASPIQINNQTCSSSAALQNGDRLQIGRTVLTFHARRETR